MNNNEKKGSHSAYKLLSVHSGVGNMKIFFTLKIVNPKLSYVSPSTGFETQEKKPI
jgi:hypothetical protein